MNILPTVLIIDNDNDALQALKDSFEDIGYQTVVTTTNSTLAIELFIAHRAEIIVLNVFMRDKDGFEVTREIRNICQKSLIIGISFEEIFLKMIKKLGANEAFPKQTETKVLVQYIHRLQKTFLPQKKNILSQENIRLAA